SPGSKRHIPMAYQNSPLTTPSNLYRRSGVSAAHPPSSSGNNDASSRPVGACHTRTTPSVPVLASSVPSGENPTDRIPPPCPDNWRSRVPSPARHTRTPSSPPLASSIPSGQKPTYHTPPPRPDHLRR